MNNSSENVTRKILVKLLRSSNLCQVVFALLLLLSPPGSSCSFCCCSISIISWAVVVLLLRTPLYVSVLWMSGAANIVLFFSLSLSLCRAESGCAKRGGKEMKEFRLLPVFVLLLLLLLCWFIFYCCTHFEKWYR